MCGQPGLWFNNSIFNSGDATERMVIACLRGDESALKSMVDAKERAEGPHGGTSLLLNATDREGVSLCYANFHMVMLAAASL